MKEVLQKPTLNLSEENKKWWELVKTSKNSTVSQMKLSENKHREISWSILNNTSGYMHYSPANHLFQRIFWIIPSLVTLSLNVHFHPFAFAVTFVCQFNTF